MGIAYDDNNDTKIIGATDSTEIGNVGDQLKSDDVARTDAVYGVLSVGTSPVELKVGASALSNRKYVVIRPQDNNVYMGFDSSVTSSNGIRLFKNEFMMLPIGTSVYLVASSGSRDVSIGELS